MSRTIEVQILGDASSLEHAFKRSGSAANTFERDIGKAGRGATAATLNFHGLGRAALYVGGSMLAAGGFVEAAKASINEATNLEDQLRRTTAVFKSSAGAVKAWSKDSAEAMGLSQSSALEAANTIGTLLINVGKTPAEAAKMSKSMVQLGTDMAAFKKVKPEVALQALESALQGRTRSLKQFGITIDAAALKQEAYRTGIAQTSVDTTKVTAAEERRAIAQAKLTKAEQDYGANTTQVAQARLAYQRAEDAVTKAQAGSAGQLTSAQKALAAYNLILGQTKGQQGAFKTSANELNIVEEKLHAQFQNIEATLGEALLPVMEKYGNELDQWLEKEQKNGNIQRDLDEAVKLLASGVHDATVIVHAAGEGFHYLSDAMGGDKDAIYALIGAWGAYKAATLGIAFASTARDIGAIGANAAVADGQVGTLAASLRGLGLIAIAPILIPIEIQIEKKIKGGLGPLGGVYDNTVGFLTGGVIGNNPIASALSWAFKGGLVPKSSQGTAANNGGLVPHGHGMPTGGGGAYSNAQLQALWIQAGGDPAMAPLMAQIAFSESGGRSGIVNSIGATGLWQIYNGPGHTGGLSQYLSPLANAKAAVAKFNSQGLGAWDASKHAWENTAAYQAYLAGGGASSGVPASTGVPLTVGTKRSSKESVLRGDALIGGGLASAIGIYGTKASGALTAGDSLYWLNLEEKDLEKAKKALAAKLGQGSKRQQAATAAEATKIAKQLDTVRDDVAKARKAVADEKFATQVKGQVSRFIASMGSLNSKYTALMLRTHFETGKALEADYTAIAGNLDQQKSRLEGEVAKLHGELAGKDKSQRAAIEAQMHRVQGLLANVNQEIQSNLDSQAQALQNALSAAQSSVSPAWSTYSQEILSSFATNMQQQLAALASDPRFFQNGTQTPSEALLGQMQQADQVGSLNDAITAAKKQLADDITAGADAATLTADQKALDAANRQLEEYQLGIKAQQERAAADKAYADAQQALTDKLNEKQGELSKTLNDFGQQLQNGTASISDLQTWLDGANPFGVDFGVNLAAMDSGSALVASDFTDLSTAAGDLKDAFASFQAWIDQQLGIDPKTASGLKLARSVFNAPTPTLVLPSIASFGGTGTHALRSPAHETHIHIHDGTFIGTPSTAVGRQLAKLVDPHLKKIVEYSR